MAHTVTQFAETHWDCVKMCRICADRSSPIRRCSDDQMKECTSTSTRLLKIGCYSLLLWSRYLRVAFLCPHSTGCVMVYRSCTCLITNILIGRNYFICEMTPTAFFPDEYLLTDTCTDSDHKLSPTFMLISQRSSNKGCLFGSNRSGWLAFWHSMPLEP